MKPTVLQVSSEDLAAYERRTGFRGIGEFFQKRGLLNVVDVIEKPVVPPHNHCLPQLVMRGGKTELVIENKIPPAQLR